MEVEGEGTGGKFPKWSSWKLPSTPYDRPPTATRKGQGWLSKLAEPASRLIGSGAIHLFPSLFTISPNLNSDPQRNNAEDSDVSRCISDNKISGQRAQDGSKVAVRPNGDSYCDEHAGDRLGNLHHDCGLSEIEQLLKNKTFSRDEFICLTEVLRSRTADTFNDNGGMKRTTDTVTPAEAVQGASSLEKEFEEKQNLQLDNRVIGRVSNPFFESAIHNEVGSSPIEIAKAFMGSQTSGSSLSSQYKLLKDERASHDFASRPSVSSPVSKSSVCWPGAMVRDVPSHLTPQFRGSRIGLHNLPRTPFSGAIHSRSTSKFKRGSQRPLNLSSSSWKQQRTPVFGSIPVMTSRNIVKNDGFGTGAAFRRNSQNPVEATTFKEVSSSHSSKYGPFPSSSSDAYEGFLSTIPMNQDGSASTSSSRKMQPVDNEALRHKFVGSPVHPQSSKIAGKILEHLDRVMVSPKEKSAELVMAFARRKSSPEFITDLWNAQYVGHDTECSDSCKGDVLRIENSLTHASGDKGKGLHIEFKSSSSNDSSGPRDTSVSASNRASCVTGCNHVVRGLHTGSSNFKDTHHSHTSTSQNFAGPPSDKHSHAKKLLSCQNQSKQDISQLVCSSSGSDLLQIQNLQPHSSGDKPALSSIYTTEPNGRHKGSIDNGFGFTFPISADYGGVFSEPPTPTIVPSFADTKSSRYKEGSAISFYSFGSSTDRGPVFSVAPTVASTVPDASFPKFNFTTEGRNKISFGSINKDTICC